LYTRTVTRAFIIGRRRPNFRRLVVVVATAAAAAAMRDGGGFVRRRWWRLGLCVMRLRRRKAWKTEWVPRPGVVAGEGAAIRARALALTLFAPLSTSRFPATVARGV